MAHGQWKKTEKRKVKFLARTELPMKSGPCPTPSKVPHPTREHAKRAKRQQSKTPGVALRVYRCPCGCYHVGSLKVGSRSAARAIANRKLEKTA